eukprot:789738-Pleurochrysis_carterae.AAC.2
MHACTRRWERALLNRPCVHAFALTRIRAREAAQQPTLATGGFVTAACPTSSLPAPCAHLASPTRAVHHALIPISSTCSLAPSLRRRRGVAEDSACGHSQAQLWSNPSASPSKSPAAWCGLVVSMAWFRART